MGRSDRQSSRRRRCSPPPGGKGSGRGIAIDDVGADPRSLALLPLIRPDVVKLDVGLVQQHPCHRSREVMNGVCAYAEQTGASILAESVEDESHLLAAQSLGASLAQGFYFGRPGPLPSNATDPGIHAITFGVPPRLKAASPFELVHARKGVAVGSKDMLLSVTRSLEQKALDLGEYGIVVASFQHARHFTAASRARYELIAARAAITAVLGVGLSPAPGVRVQGAELAAGDAVAREWDIAVVGPHYSGALVARDLGDTGPDRERRFEFALTFDRELSLGVAAALLSRVGSAAAPTLQLVA